MQKKVGNALYVFDTTPFTITEDTNVEVIYVQNECLKGYLELNTELESKIKTFNQWLLCVNAPWADGGAVTSDWKTDPADGSTVTSLKTIHVWNTTVSSMGCGSGKITVKRDGVELEKIPDANFGEDLNELVISTSVEYTQDGTYTFEAPEGFFIDESGNALPAVTFTYNIGNGGGATEQPQNYHLLTVSNHNKLYVSCYDTNLPPGGADNAWFNSFNAPQREAGMIGNAERNKIYCNAGAKIFINEEIDTFETVTGLELIDTQWGKKYGFIMGDTDMTVDFSYTLKPTYNINFSEDSTANNDITIVPNPQFANKSVSIRFKNNQSSSTITVTSADVELTYKESNDEYSFTMPDHDITIKAVYTNA